MNYILNLIYKTRAVVHGFCLGKSIITNANLHTKRRYVFNLDLKDFFGSISFARVRGMLMAPPYNLGSGASTVIAQLCTFNGRLPQGAPTSPVITNMICGRLDSELKRLANAHHGRYTRYADDITISASTRSFPEALARVDRSGGTSRIVAGDAVTAIIQANGFEINPDKLRLLLQGERQEVTGLVANRFPNVPRSYIRQLRGLFHAWEKHGVEAAANDFFKKHDLKRRANADVELLRRVIRGKIEFVGRVRSDDFIYWKLLSKFAQLNPNLKISIPESADLNPQDIWDDLLPVLRKKTFLKDLPLAIEKAAISPCSLLMIDLDHFKAVNDEHGHPTGDKVLIDCATCIIKRCEGKGKVYRYGGEEVAVLLLNFSTSEAAHLAELIRADIERNPASDKKLSITASIGVATVPDHGQDMLGAADKALYQAKNNGRNRVCVASKN